MYNLNFEFFYLIGMIFVIATFFIYYFFGIISRSHKSFNVFESIQQNIKKFFLKNIQFFQELKSFKI